MGLFSKPKTASTGPSYAELKAQEDKAEDEAQRKARAEAVARQGSRSTLLTDASMNTDFGSNPSRRKTLLGGTA